MEIEWNLLKNERLKRTRGISFEEILKAKQIDRKKHSKLTHQNLLLFWYKNYVWVVPYVESERGIFLKTIYQCRKYTKIYKRGGRYEKNETD